MALLFLLLGGFAQVSSSFTQACRDLLHCAGGLNVVVKMCRPLLMLAEVAESTTAADVLLLCANQDISSCTTENDLSLAVKDSDGTDTSLTGEGWLALGKPGSFKCLSVAGAAAAAAAAGTPSSAAVIGTELEFEQPKSSQSNDQATSAMAGLQSILDLPLPVVYTPAPPVQRCLFDSSHVASVDGDAGGEAGRKTGGAQHNLSIHIGNPSLSNGGHGDEQERVQRWLATSEAHALLRMCVIETPICCDIAACAKVAVDAPATANTPLPPPAFRMLGLPC
jgi:hypothetical protein